MNRKQQNRRILILALILLPVSFAGVGIASAGDAEPSRWQNGPSADDTFFPIGVWLQNPRNAKRYKAAGINLYIGLWRGPTEEQLDALTRAGMPVICAQNTFGLSQKDNPIIIGWMHNDEPDNAQSLGEGKGYGPPILPAKVVADYQRMQTADPTRPVLLNLGQGVAYDNYIGRGVRRNHMEDYPEYVKGCDIASFDIYPVVHDKPEIAGKLEFVPRGVERLVNWTGGSKPVWNCIECTHISNPEEKATPEQIRAEVWMALIRGSRGLIYFVHQFQPTFREAALLDDPETLEGVTAINRQIHGLAPVLNSPNIMGGVEVTSSKVDVPIAWMQKRHGGSTYLFTVNMRNEATHGTFALSNLPGGATVDVLGEGRKIVAGTGAYSDEFRPYEVHLYRIDGRK